MCAKQISTPAPGPILLCIDLQPVFLNAIPNSEALIKRCSFAIQAAQGLGIQVVFTEQVPQKLGATAPELLALVKKPVQLGKNTFSALADDGLRETLTQQYGADHIILIGIETSVCVYQTAIDSIRSDIPVTLLTDCLSGRREEDGKVALDALARSGANVLPSETIFYSMLGGISHPYFKSYTQLVKKYS